MTGSSQGSGIRGGLPAQWGDGLAVITGLLLVTAAGQMFLVVPRYRRFLEGIGVEPSLPSRLAIGTSRLGVLLFTVAFLGIGVAYWKQRKGHSGLLTTALSLVGLLATVYLALVTCVYWDVARVMGRIH